MMYETYILENIQSEKIFDEIARLMPGYEVSDQPHQARGEIFKPLVNQHLQFYVDLSCIHVFDR